LPRCPALPVAPFDEFRVTPDPASSGSVGDGSSSCPESRILSALPVVKPRVSPKPHCTRCASRCIPGSPRLLHLPTLPAMDFRVAPNLASFSASGASASGCPAASLFEWRLSMSSPSCPGFLTFRLCRRRIFELPRISRPSAPPLPEPQVSLELRVSGCASR